MRVTFAVDLQGHDGAVAIVEIGAFDELLPRSSTATAILPLADGGLGPSPTTTLSITRAAGFEVDHADRVDSHDAELPLSAVRRFSRHVTSTL
jgi:hypothetical protein